MKNRLPCTKERLGKQSREKFWVKAFILAVSFVQTYWVPIACAAGTAVAATMFGDKAHLLTVVKDIEEMAAQKKPA